MHRMHRTIRQSYFMSPVLLAFHPISYHLEIQGSCCLQLHYNSSFFKTHSQHSQERLPLWCPLWRIIWWWWSPSISFSLFMFLRLLQQFCCFDFRHWHLNLFNSLIRFVFSLLKTSVRVMTSWWWGFFLAKIKLIMIREAGVVQLVHLFPSCLLACCS